ncbi:OmpL47-type beta-barrel domain-containing protein [Jiangella gansuensis]|uniref:OmpL47-type beta-barrel domain-containing protein n=1 Tax=Jiangella gansuensis TaxID=281473 RepID=UPI0004B271FE|nr:Ig-like domain repeat protein [Jiangella gansuensis]
MFRRLLAALTGRHHSAAARSRTSRQLTVALLTAALTALCLVPASASLRGEPSPSPSSAAADQVLTWTANNSVTDYASFPTTATAGPATIVFENSVATGNTTGMPHTLTFETANPDYNQDVSLDITATPFDGNGGRWQAEVTLSPGTYYYFCAFPGHGEMNGVLVVTGDGGDTTPPEVSATVSGDQNTEGDYIGSATVTVNATDAGSGVDTVEYEIRDTGFQPYTGPVTVSEPGDYSVQYRATDNDGNVSEVGSVSFTVVEAEPDDTTPPTVSASVAGEQDDDGNYIGSASVTVSATDAESGVGSVEYNLDGAGFTPYTTPVVVDETGAHTLQYRATDNAGNVSDVGSVSFTVVEPEPDDTTPPTVSAAVAGDQDDDGNYIGSATVTVNATDAESGVQSVEYNLNGAGFVAYTGPVVVDDVGAHALQYRATDNAGNVSEVGSVSFAVVEPEPDDTTPPTASAAVAGEQDDDGNYIASATVTVTATDAGSGVASVAYALNDGAFVPYTEPVVVSEVGAHTVQYRATDNAGNVSEVGSVSFTVVEPEPDDTTPPTVSAAVSGDQNEDGDYVGSASVRLTASDAQSGVASVEYNLNGAGFTAYTAPVVVDEAGAHTVQYRATDNAGNVSEVGSVSFTVVEPEPDDTTPPTVSAAVAGDQDDDGNYIGAATVTVTATDAESGVASIAYALNDGAFVDYTEPVVVSEPGEHTLRYRATDNAGNTSEIGTVAFGVVEPSPDDTTPPTVSAAVAGDQNEDGEYIGAATVTVTASDAQSGVASVEYNLNGAGFTAYTAPVVVDEAGAHTVQYRATDNAGNVSEVGSVSFTVAEPEPDDTTPPTVSAAVAGDQDDDGNYIGAATVTVTATDTGSGVASVDYAIGDGAFMPYTEPVRVNDVGTHTVQYRATDNAGNTSEAGSVTFTIVEGDGDACPDSDTRDTVIIGGIDSTVVNVDTGDGCTINDLIDEDGDWPNHGAFVRHVTAVANQLVTDGVITNRERGMITRTAAASDVGRTPAEATTTASAGHTHHQH